ncbi:hypothetical protein [Pseudomonas sp. SDO5271_S396]
MPNLDQGQPVPMDDTPVRVPDSLLSDQLDKVLAKPALDAVPWKVPVEVLDDREFELLAYRLFQDGQGSHAKTQCNLGIDHDDTALMQGSGDMGRDVTLYRKGAAVGAVQCKHYAKPFEQPDALRQICRFILAARQHPELMPDPQNFTYVLMLSRSANDKTSSLFRETTTTLKNNPDLLPNAVREAREAFKKLQAVSEAESLAYARDILGKIKLKLVQGIDLAIWLTQRDAIFASFFQTRVVVDKDVVLAHLLDIQKALRGDFSIAFLDRARDTSALSIARANEQDGGHRQIMLEEVYTPRSLEAEIDRRIEAVDLASGEGTLIAVIAPAGFGKSSLLWGCHRRWSARGDTATLTLAATQLATLIEQGQFDRVRGTLLNRAATLRDGGVRFVVYLDTFDVLMHSVELSTPALALLYELVEHGASLVFSTRPEEVADIKFEKLTQQAVRLYLGEYDPEEFAQALKTYCAAFYPNADANAQAALHATRLTDLVALGRPAREVCLNPLALRMLFEIYAPAEVPENINSAQLYWQYFKERVAGDQRAGIPKAASAGKDLSEAAKKIALAMFSLRVPALSQQKFNQAEKLGITEHDRAELISRHLLRRTASRVEFFHQTFFEYIAGLALAEQSGYDPAHCMDDLLTHADDSFELPIREHQLWHCAHQHTFEPHAMDATLEALLNQSHPGPQGAALRLHMMSEDGYEPARAYVLNKAREGSVEVLKRYCQLIHHLAPTRAGEVHSIILASQAYQSWEVVNWTSRMMIWLSPLDWPACKALIDDDLVSRLRHAAKDSGYLVQIVTNILRGGLRTDADLVLSIAISCLHQLREKETTLDFLAHCAKTINEDQARYLATQLLRWSGKNALSLVPAATRCLVTLWSRFPKLCDIQGDSLPLIESTTLRLQLSTLAQLDCTGFKHIHSQLLARLDLNQKPGALRVLLGQFVTPLLRQSASTCATRTLAIQQCERLLENIEITNTSGQWSQSEAARCTLYFVGQLKIRGECPPSLEAFITQLSTQDWLDSRSLAHLLPIALSDEVITAQGAFATIMATPKDYPHHMAALRKWLPKLIRTPHHLGMTLNLAVVDKARSTAISALIQASGSEDWQGMHAVALPYAQKLRYLCLQAATSHRDDERKSVYLLLELLIKHALIDVEDVGYTQLLEWALNETQRHTRAQPASQVLLVTGTTMMTAEHTILMLLNATEGQPAELNVHLIHQLQRTLSMQGLQLSDSVLDKLVEFALQPEPTQSQVCLMGRVMDIHLFDKNWARADQTALALLRSPSIGPLSSMQKGRLGHQLDKTFQRLYRQLSVTELQAHFAALHHLDALLGRLVVVAFCKADRPDRDILAQQLIDDKKIHSTLRTIVHDYRQHRWV